MRIEGYNTHGKPVVRINDYYRDDYEILQEILSCRWSEVLIVGLRRFGKSSLLRRIEGFINKQNDYRAFLEKGLDGWNREIDGNPPRKEFFDELRNLNAKALYISFLDSYNTIEDNTCEFFQALCGDHPFELFKIESVESYLPAKMFILMDEFSKLAELTNDAENKREFFLKIFRSAQNLSKEVIFVMAEPPAMFSVFETSIKENSSIAEITDALQNRKMFTLNGLSTNEKMSLFCLKKTKNYGRDIDGEKIRQIIDRLGGIPLEIQIAGETFFSSPGKTINDILNDVAAAFGGNMKRIIQTMNCRQQVFIRLVAEFETDCGGLPWERIKTSGQKLFENLRNFGILKKDGEGRIRIASDPVHSILMGELEDWSTLVKDEIYDKELKSLILSAEEIKVITSPGYAPWDGRIQIHHFSDLALGNLTVGFSCDEDTDRIDLFSLNNKENPFEAYFKLLQTHPKYRPHIIIFTGDIALNHHSLCYKALKEFILEITSLMIPLPGEGEVLPGKQVFLVPGEMDISNPTEKEVHCKEGLDAFDPCNFSDFFRTFGKFAIPPENASQNGLDHIVKFELPPTHGVPGYNLEILPFNSATMVWDDKANLRRLTQLKHLAECLTTNDETLIRNVMKQLLGDDIGYLNIKKMESCTEDYGSVEDTLRIALVHHNLNPHIVRGIDYTVDMLNAHEAKTALLKNGFSIILHGHQLSPLFIKETLYLSGLNQNNEKKGLKTLFMNGAGKFSESKFPVDKDHYGSSFNSYDLRRINSWDDEIVRYREGGYKIKSTVFKYNDKQNKFIPDHLKVNEDIVIDED